jgi:peroxiredoxin
MVCQAEAPSVEEAHQRWSGKATFVGVATGGTPSDFARFAAEHGLTFPQIDDASGTVFDRFGITLQHAVVVIAPDGAVTTMPGAVDEPALERILADITT